MQDVNIERATLLDVPRLAMMVYSIYEEHEKLLDEKVKAAILIGLMQVVQSQDRAIFAAAVKKHGKRQLVGMIGVRVQLHPIDGTVAYGDYLFLEPKFRGNGLAGKLLKASEEFAIEHGAVRAYTEADPNAVQALMEFGFEHESTVMSKKLEKKKEETGVKE